MMDKLLVESVDLITKIIGASAAVIGLPLVWWQVRQARTSVRQIEKARVADLKPYVTVSLKRSKVRDDDAVVLTLSNCGRTPALNVKVRFENGRAWNYVGGAKFAFSDEVGITVIAPGETKTYFLGRLVPGTEFARLAEEDIIATIEFGSHVSRDVEIQTVRIGLNDHRFGVATIAARSL